MEEIANKLLARCGSRKTLRIAAIENQIASTLQMTMGTSLRRVSQ